MWTHDCALAYFFSVMAVASPSTDLGDVDALAAPDSPTMHCVWTSRVSYASARLMVGEALEQQARYTDAIKVSE